MTKELSQVLAAKAVRRLSQEEELNLKPERSLRMRWVLTWKYTESGDKKAKARLVILVYQHPELSSEPTAAPTLGKMSRHLKLQACALHKLRVHFGDVSSGFPANISLGRASRVDDQRSSRSRVLVLRFGRKTCSICAFDEIVFLVSRQHPTRGGWISHRNFLSLVGNPCRLINVCGVVILMTVS